MKTIDDDNADLSGVNSISNVSARSMPRLPNRLLVSVNNRLGVKMDQPLISQIKSAHELSTNIVIEKGEQLTASNRSFVRSRIPIIQSFRSVNLPSIKKDYWKKLKIVLKFISALKMPSLKKIHNLNSLQSDLENYNKTRLTILKARKSISARSKIISPKRFEFSKFNAGFGFDDYGRSLKL